MPIFIKPREQVCRERAANDAVFYYDQFAQILVDNNNEEKEQVAKVFCRINIKPLYGYPFLIGNEEGFVFQKYKFAKRNYAGGKPDKTSLDLGVKFTVNLDDANSMYVFKTLRQWTDLIYNPLTGAMGIKQDYTGTIVISIFNKNGNVFRRITCKDCFPLKAIDPMELDYLNGTTLYEINLTWAVDYWEDLFT